MNQRPRRSLVLGITALVALGLTACGGSSQGEEPDGPYTLTYTYWGGTERIERHEALVQLYEDEVSDATIDASASPGTTDHVEQLAVEASGGNMPDVAQTQDRYLWRFDTSLLDLQPYIDDGTIDVSHLTEADLAAGRVDDRQVMIPTAGAYHTVNFDPVLYDQAGVPSPDNETTYDEYAQRSIALAESGELPDDTYAATSMCDTYWAFFSWLKSYGVDPYVDGQTNFTVEHVEDWFEYWQSLEDEGAVPPTEIQIENEAGGGTGSPEETMLARGLAANAFSPGNQTDVKSSVRGSDLEMAGMPIGPEGGGNIVIRSGMSISANSDHPQRAAEFINWWLNDEDAGIEYAGHNGVPLASVQLDALRAADDSSVLVTYEELVEANNIGEFEPLPEAAHRLDEALPRYCQAIGFGESSIEDAAQDFFNEVGN